MERTMQKLTVTKLKKWPVSLSNFVYLQPIVFIATTSFRNKGAIFYIDIDIDIYNYGMKMSLSLLVSVLHGVHLK